MLGWLPSPWRERLGSAVDRRVAARLAAELPAAVDDAVERARRARLLEPRIWGPPERLTVAPSAELANVYLNTLSGSITIAADAVLGHDVAIVAARYDEEHLEGARAPLPDGSDVHVGRGAHVGARAVIVGRCRIGPYAVVAPGAVVTGDVVAGAVVAGSPATVVRRLGVDGDLPPSVEVETDVGRMRLLLADEVITPALRGDGRWEPDHADALRSFLRPGMTVVDVGANVGYTVLVAARAIAPGGRVVAIEPDPDNVALLRANVAANDAPVEVVAAAAWYEAGTVQLAVSDINAGDHRVGALTGERRTVPVEAVRLDDLPGLASADVIKLDTQGTEHRALAGAHELLARSRPVILCEFWPHGIRDQGDDPAAVLRGHRELGYALRVLEEPALGEAPDDAAILAAVEDREDPVGGFATLVMVPLPAGQQTVAPHSK